MLSTSAMKHTLYAKHHQTMHSHTLQYPCPIFSIIKSPSYIYVYVCIKIHRLANENDRLFIFVRHSVYKYIRVFQRNLV